MDRNPNPPLVNASASVQKLMDQCVALNLDVYTAGKSASDYKHSRDSQYETYRTRALECFQIAMALDDNDLQNDEGRLALYQAFYVCPVGAEQIQLLERAVVAGVPWAMNLLGDLYAGKPRDGIQGDAYRKGKLLPSEGQTGIDAALYWYRRAYKADPRQWYSLAKMLEDRGRTGDVAAAFEAAELYERGAKADKCEASQTTNGEDPYNRSSKTTQKSFATSR